MNKVGEIPWPRILAEGAAIVVSILLAVSIEAWWNARQDIEDEQVILAALVDEFKAKKNLPQPKVRNGLETPQSASQATNILQLHHRVIQHSEEEILKRNKKYLKSII